MMPIKHSMMIAVLLCVLVAIGTVQSGRLSTASALSSPLGTADVSVTLQGPATLGNGRYLTYKATVKNLGPDRSDNITLWDVTDPTLLTFVPSESDTSCTKDTYNGKIFCLIPSIESGDSVTLLLTYTSNQCDADALKHTTTIKPLTADPDLTNNVSNEVTTTFTCSYESGPNAGDPQDNRTRMTAQLAVPLKASIGSAFPVSITIANSGPGDAQGITASFPFLQNVLAWDPTQSDSACQMAADKNDTLLCTISTLPAGTSKTFSLFFTVQSCTALPLKQKVTAVSSNTDLVRTITTSNFQTTTFSCPASLRPVRQSLLERARARSLKRSAAQQSSSSVSRPPSRRR